MKNNKGKQIITSLIILLPMLFGILVWNRLPEQLISHWNPEGIADGWSSRFTAVFVIPLFILFVHWFCIFVTARDPKSQNQSSKIFDTVLWICPGVSLIVGALIYATAFGKSIQPVFVITLCMGVLFIAIGNYLPKCRQNSTIGIRIKWTLEDEENWNTTHRFCGKVYVAGGFLMLITSFLPETFLMYVFLTEVVLLSLVPVGYSYYYHKTKA